MHEAKLRGAELREGAPLAVPLRSNLQMKFMALKKHVAGLVAPLLHLAESQPHLSTLTQAILLAPPFGRSNNELAP